MHTTNSSVWRDFERELIALNRSKQTIAVYREAAEQLDKHLSGSPFEQATKNDIQDYISATLATKSPATAHCYYRALRRLFNWMAAEDYVTVSPMARMGAPKIDTTPVAVPHVDDVRLLLRTCEVTNRTPESARYAQRRDEAIIRLCCEPGAPRASEAANLTLDDVDIARDLLTVRGKGAKIRLVPYGNKSARALSRYLRLRSRRADAAAPWLWLRSNRQAAHLTRSGLYQMIERRCTMAGIARIHPHQLRHFAADAFYRANGSEQDAMRLFGWSSSVMAHHYAEATAGGRAIDTARALQVGDQL